MTSNWPKSKMANCLQQWLTEKNETKKRSCYERLICLKCECTLTRWRQWRLDSDGSNTISSNIDWALTSFFEHWMNLNMFIYWWSKSNTWILASNEWTSNIKPKRPSLDLQNHSLNRLKHVYLLVIILEHPILALNDQTSNFLHSSTHN